MELTESLKHNCGSTNIIFGSGRIGEGDTFYTEWEETYESFDQMGLHENLLRGIYAYGEFLAAVTQRQTLSYCLLWKVSSSQLCAFLPCIMLTCILNASLKFRMVKANVTAGVYLCIRLWLPGAASLAPQPYCLLTQGLRSPLPFSRRGSCPLARDWT